MKTTPAATADQSGMKMQPSAVGPSIFYIVHVNMCVTVPGDVFTIYRQWVEGEIRCSDFKIATLWSIRMQNQFKCRHQANYLDHLVVGVAIAFTVVVGRMIVHAVRLFWHYFVLGHRTAVNHRRCDQCSKPSTGDHTNTKKNDGVCHDTLR